MREKISNKSQEKRTHRSLNKMAVRCETNLALPWQQSTALGGAHGVGGHLQGRRSRARSLALTKRGTHVPGPVLLCSPRAAFSSISPRFANLRLVLRLPVPGGTVPGLHLAAKPLGTGCDPQEQRPCHQRWGAARGSLAASAPWEKAPGF